LRAQFLEESGATVTSTKTSAPASSMTTSSKTTSVYTSSITAIRTGSATASSPGEPTSTGSGKNNSGGDEGDGEGTLSSATRAGIIAGSTSGGALVLGLIAFFIVQHRRNSQSGHEEAHPMLFQRFGGHSGVGGFDAAADGQGEGGGSMDLAAMAHDGLEMANAHGVEKMMPVSDQKWRPGQRFNWESPYEPPWSSPLQDPGLRPGRGQLSLVPVQNSPEGYHQIRPQLHELASPEMQAPIEMAATPLDGQKYSGAGWGTGR
jgi:hypothetical protein